MARNPIPIQLRSDHLVLLMGENPLPNWVAAKLLLRDGGWVHIVHSPDTKPEAERLRYCLSNIGVNIDLVSVDESDGGDVFRKVRIQADRLQGTIGLNYTGGTKMMAVHAHRALRSHSTHVVLSYLDARKLRMKFDDAPNSQGYYMGSLDDIRIDLDSLARLHEQYRDRELSFETVPKCIDAASILCQLLRYRSAEVAWRIWCDEAIGSSFPNRNRREIERLEAEKMPKVEQFASLVSRNEISCHERAHINSLYEQFLAVINKGGNSGEAHTLKSLSETNGFRNAWYLAQWLHGTWLEHYTLWHIKNCADEVDLNQNGVGMNFNPVNDQRQFQADVLAIRGYQLFYFSCTSDSDKGRAKQKLFEAMLRARQLGGEEAKVGLICTSDDPDNILREARSEWQAGSNIKVFGRADLYRLREGLKTWMRE